MLKIVIISSFYYLLSICFLQTLISNSELLHFILLRFLVTLLSYVMPMFIVLEFKKRTLYLFIRTDRQIGHQKNAHSIDISAPNDAVLRGKLTSQQFLDPFVKGKQFRSRNGNFKQTII